MDLDRFVNRARDLTWRIAEDAIRDVNYSVDYDEARGILSRLDLLGVSRCDSVSGLLRRLVKDRGAKRECQKDEDDDIRMALERVARADAEFLRLLGDELMDIAGEALNRSERVKRWAAKSEKIRNSPNIAPTGENEGGHDARR